MELDVMIVTKIKKKKKSKGDAMRNNLKINLKIWNTMRMFII